MSVPFERLRLNPDWPPEPSDHVKAILRDEGSEAIRRYEATRTWRMQLIELDRVTKRGNKKEADELRAMIVRKIEMILMAPMPTDLIFARLESRGKIIARSDAHPFPGPMDNHCGVNDEMPDWLQKAPRSFTVLPI